MMGCMHISTHIDFYLLGSALLALGINGHTNIMPNVFTQKHYWGYAAKNDEARGKIRKWR